MKSLIFVMSMMVACSTTFARGVNFTDLQAVVKVSYHLSTKDRPPPTLKDRLIVPDYPADYPRAGISAKVLFEGIVTESGVFEQIQLTKVHATEETREDFASAAREALERWRFLPADKQAPGTVFPIKIEGSFHFLPRDFAED